VLLAHRRANGTVRFFSTVARDISECKLAEEALRESEERYRRLVESSTEVVAVQSHGRIVYVNPAGARLLGAATPDALIGRDLLRFLAATERAGARARADRLQRGAAAVEQYEAHLHSIDGRSIEAEVTAIASTYRAEPAVQYIIRDVTERHHLEEQFRQAQKMEAIGRLAGGIAHDFNNLLTAIKGHAELILDDDTLPAHRREDLAEIREAAERAANLTRQLLAFSRKQVLKPEILDLNAVTRSMRTMLERLIGEDVHFVGRLAPDLGPVRADPGQLEQVLMNLIVNARDAMPGGGTLLIETANVEVSAEDAARHTGAEPGSYVLLAVSDTGVGMSRDVQEKIFEPFFTTKEPGKGTGLGLATVYGIVKQSGGLVEVESEPGQGTTFRVYLPRVDAPAPPHPGPAPVPASPAGLETILLVEDEAAVRSFVRKVLRRKGYNVLEAASRPEALRLSRAYRAPIHLLLTDVVMPEMGGREIADRLTAERPGMRVLFTSGYTEDAVVDRGVLIPGIRFLGKPFTPQDLTRKVREVLDAPADEKNEQTVTLAKRRRRD